MLLLLHSYQHLPLGIMIVRRLYHFSNIVSNNLFQIYTPDDSPKSSKVGAFFPRPPPFCEKISVFGHQKSRKGTNPIRPNDATPSFLPIRRIAFVYTALYSDVLSVQTCKKSHPSFVSKLGWLYVCTNKMTQVTIARSNGSGCSRGHPVNTLLSS